LILDLLKSTLNLNNHIKAAFFTTCALLIFVALYFSELSNKPMPFEESPSITEGTLVWADGNQRGISLIIREKSTNELRKFFALPDYTGLPKGFTKSRGNHITITHYGKLVTGCNLESVGFCTPRCGEAYECKVQHIKHSAEALKHTSITIFVFLVGIFLHYFFWAKNSPPD
jgi:hypothetical protein